MHAGTHAAELYWQEADEHQENLTAPYLRNTQKLTADRTI